MLMNTASNYTALQQNEFSYCDYVLVPIRSEDGEHPAVEKCSNVCVAAVLKLSQDDQKIV